MKMAGILTSIGFNLMCLCCVAEEDRLGASSTNRLSASCGKTIKTCSFPVIQEPGLDTSDNISAHGVISNWYNLALGKPVTASDESYISELAVITDGVTAFDITNAVLFDVSGNDCAPWVQIDLGDSKTICAIRVWHRYDPDGYIKYCFRDVVVQLIGPDARTPIRTVFNNDYDNTSRLGKGADRPYIESSSGKLIVLAAPITGRYVRLYSAANCWGSDGCYYTEVQVLGPK